MDRHFSTNTNASGSESLWKNFIAARDTDEYYRAWLSLQSSLLVNAVQSILVMGSIEDESFAPVAKWPEDSVEGERLADISERVLAEHCGMVVKLQLPDGVKSSLPPRYGVAYPVMMDSAVLGVVSVELAASDEAQLKEAMEQLQWGVSWLEVLLRRSKAKEDGLVLDNLGSAVDILATLLSEDSFDSASMAFVTEMATRIGADRVSFGIMKRGRPFVRAISHSATFGERMNLNRAIAKAMEEAVVQRSEIIYPVTDDKGLLVVRDHEALSKEYGVEAVFTIPIFGNGRYYGAITIERSVDKPFSSEERDFCRSVISLAGPALETKRVRDMPLIEHIHASCKNNIAKFLGPRHTGRKLLSVAFVVLVIFFAFARGDYRVSADAVMEGAVRRVIVAPFDGYVDESFVRAGDVVKEGMVLCTLDDRELRLERLNWASRLTQLKRRYQGALAAHDRAEAGVINAQIDQAAAKLNLVEMRLARTRVLAPFDGVIVSGDLSLMLGGAVSTGDVLFETTPLSGYRVILDVDERRISDLQEGQSGTLVLSALPGTRFYFVVERVTSIATAAEGSNFFRVEARLEGATDKLRPGMEGVGKIDIDRRSLFSILTRSLREWLSLWGWSLWP